MRQIVNLCFVTVVTIFTAIVLTPNLAKSEEPPFCNHSAVAAPDGWIARFGNREFRVCGNGRSDRSATLDMSIPPLLGNNSLLSRRGTGAVIFGGQKNGNLVDRIGKMAQYHGEPQVRRHWEGRDYFGWEIGGSMPTGGGNLLWVFWPSDTIKKTDRSNELPLHMLMCDNLDEIKQRVHCSLWVSDQDLTLQITLQTPDLTPPLREPFFNIATLVHEAMTLLHAAEVTDLNRAALSTLPRLKSR